LPFAEVPGGFIRITEGRREILAREDFLPYLREKGLLDPGRLFKELEGMRGGKLKGRGELLLLEGGIRLVVRKYRHGGVLRVFSKDLFVFGSRPFKELLVTEWLRGKGIRTLEVVAAIKEKVGPLFYRGYLITRFLPKAKDMTTYLLSSPPSAERRKVIERAALVTREVHRLGLLHADLHLKNFLVDGEEVLLIDFDRAKLTTPPKPTKVARNLKRLDRSAEKLKRWGVPISVKDKLAFWRVYCENGDDIKALMENYHKKFRLYSLLYRLGWGIEGILYRRRLP